jgi:predicted dehydrogenase
MTILSSTGGFSISGGGEEVPMAGRAHMSATIPFTGVPTVSETGSTRREFIRNTAALGAAGVMAERLRAQDAPGPNERIHVGLIGCGGMGRGNLGNAAQHPDVVVTGACDVWPERRNAVVDQFKDSCKPYSDYRELLAAPDIDAVIIATPPHWHCLVAVAACAAGKDIYLQKPMTLHLGESLAVRNAVERHDVISQIGTQIHAGENYRRIVELIRSGNLGPVGVVRTFNVMNQGPEGVGKSDVTQAPEGMDWDFWCGPAPLIDYNPILAANSYNHGSWMSYSGGWTPGMAPHIIDLPIWALELGYPTEVSAVGGRYVVDDDGDAYDHHEVLWRYPKTTMTWMSSLTNSYGFDLHGDPVPRRRLGIYFHGLNGTMYADYGSFTIIPEGDRMDGLEAPDPYIPPSPGHELEWVECIKTREQPSCSVFYHTRVDVPLVLSLLSLKLGRSIRFDPEEEEIVDDREAEKMAVPEYRDPWEFPKEYL